MHSAFKHAEEEGVSKLMHQPYDARMVEGRYWQSCHNGHMREGVRVKTT